MINLNTKFEVSTIIGNEDMKGNAKICKNSRFEWTFGDLGATRRVHLWLVGKHVVDSEAAEGKEKLGGQREGAHGERVSASL